VLAMLSNGYMRSDLCAVVEELGTQGVAWSAPDRFSLHLCSSLVLTLVARTSAQTLAPGFAA
jgi:hypothetical protein